MRAIIDAANKLFDPPTVEADEIIASWRKGEKLLEDAVAGEPDHVEALYTLAWAYGADRAPPEGIEQRIAGLCERLRSLTAAVPIESSSAPGIDARARAYALAWDLPERAHAATVAGAAQYARDAADAWTLREAPWTQRAVLGAEAGVVFAKAREAGDLEPAYRWLLDWVAKHPVCSSYLARKAMPYCRGLEPFFEDAGFLAWIDAQPAQQVIAADDQSTATAHAAGADKLAHAYNNHEPARFGRLGRLLALRALGAPLQASAARNMGGGVWNTVELAAQASPALLPELVKRGLSLDEGTAGVPPLVALTQWGDRDAMAALLAAGANREATDPDGRTALDIAKKVKNAKSLKVLGAPRPKSKLAVAALRAAIPAGSPDELTTLLDDIEASGLARWEDAAAMIDRVDPEARHAFARLLRSVGGKPTHVAKLSVDKPRIVLGDLEVDGELAVMSEMIVTGDVRCGRFSADETGSLYVGGGFTASYAFAEGDLWIAGDAAIDVAWAEYEAGSFVVGGTLTSEVLLTARHEVQIGKRVVKETIDIDAADREELWQRYATPPKATKPKPKPKPKPRTRR